jgi:hypothetical protein
MAKFLKSKRIPTLLSLKLLQRHLLSVSDCLYLVERRNYVDDHKRELYKSVTPLIGTIIRVQRCKM